MKKTELVVEGREQGPVAESRINVALETGLAEPPEQAGNRSRLIPVPRWNDYHVWPPIGGLRHLIFHEKSNGFSECLVRVGRRVLIDEDRFFQWTQKANDRRNH